MIYLDNAATSWPKPESVRQAVIEALDRYGANPGRASHQMAIQTSEMIFRTRSALARLINAESAERVAFCTNATDALNLGIYGLIRPGDKVVTSSMEHNSVRRPLRRMRDLGADVVVVQAERTGVVDPDRIRAAARGAQMIAITHASNVNGAVQPIAEIGRIARETDALLLVDAAQSIGATPIDVQALRVDLLAFPGHKSLLGPSGTGGLYIGPRVDVAELVPLHAGGTGVRSEDDVQPLELPSRYESGTVNTLGIAGLAAGIKHITTLGIDQIQSEHQRRRTRLVAGLVESGVTVFESGQPDAADVVSFDIPGWQQADVGAVLDQSFGIACRTGLHCAPTACATIGAGPNGTIRFSPGLTTTDEEIDAAIMAVAEIAREAMVPS
jgi:cysteine desulfurase/selenocysteine lyase